MMNSSHYLLQVRCVGALIRKPRTWPPTVSVPLSAATKLAESRNWQPVIWSVVQKRAARTLPESD
jgi:hypothetical protein